MNKPRRRKRAALPVPTGPQPIVLAPVGANLEAPPLPGIGAPIITQTVEALWADGTIRAWLLKREDIRRATLEAFSTFVKSL